MSAFPPRDAASRLVAWTPLLVGALSSYGPVGFNYGFALYFLTYRHGFVKRGLVGELLSPLTYLPRGGLLVIEYVFLGIAFAVTYLVFRRMLFGSISECRLAVALLCAPALLPHLGYMFTQPDVTLYILLLTCLALFLHAAPWVATGLTCVICCLALLVHEAFCLMFYPLIVAILLRLCVRRRLHWFAAVAHVVVAAGAFAAILHWGTLKIAPAALVAEAQTRTNVGVQQQVFDVMASTLSEQRALVRRMYTPGVLRILALTLVLSIPYFLLLARLLHRAMQAAGYAAFQRIATTLLFVAPLLLCALGHDTTRWIGAMCIDATLFVMYLYLDEPVGSPTHRILRGWADGPTYLLWVVYLLAIGPYGATGIRSAEQIASAWSGP